MRIHHLNCGSMCPLGGRFMGGQGLLAPAFLVCHCLLIETDGQGLVLVDTGFGLGDVKRPRVRISGPFLALNRPPLREEETARRQVERLGFRAEDVRHIVLTHLDFDHAGGLEDFPEATVHVLDTEWQAARHRSGLLAYGRYRPAQWDRVPRWRRYKADGEHWFGFESVRDLTGLPPDILMIPLAGHTWGHCGVAVRQGAGWLLHAGDAYFHHGEMDHERRRCPSGLRLYQRMMEVDPKARIANLRRLRELARTERNTVRITCSHDPRDLERARRRPTAE